MLRRALLVQVQAKQDRQTVVVTRTEWQLDDHAQHDPTVSPVGDRFAATGQQRIVMHARAEHLLPPLAGQGVVEREHNRAVQPGLDQIENCQPDRVQRPARGAEDAMVGREVFVGRVARRQNHSRDGAPTGKDSAGCERCQAGEGRRGHCGGESLQQHHESWYKFHCEPPCPAV